MRKFLFISIIILVQNVYSQQSYFNSSPTNTPNILPPSVSSFQKVNSIQVSNYTGRANVSIPFYEINQDGIIIPISVSYNTSGIKLNDVASNVGMNWSLNASGLITKTVKGVDDFKRGIGAYYDWENHMTYITSTQGWLSYYTKFQIPYMTEVNEGDSAPDIFKVIANNLDFSFIHNKADFIDNYNYPGENLSISYIDNNGIQVNLSNSNPVDGKPFLLDGDNGTKIEEIYGDITCGRWGYDTGLMNTINSEFFVDGPFNPNYKIYGIKSIKITTINGIEYLFDKLDVSQFTLDKDCHHYITDLSLSSEINIVTYHLSKITDLKTKKIIEYEYETYSQEFSEIIDNSEIIVNTSCAACNERPNEKSDWLRYPKLNRLKKIIFEEGYINFKYELNRLDLPGDKALTCIELFNKYDNLIKKQNFTYDYYQSTGSVSNVFTKRLKLLQIEDVGNQSTNQNNSKYVFTYNNSNLPPRNIAVTDLFGYHNGEADRFNYNYSTNEYESISPFNVGKPNPKIYFNVNKGILSFFHTNIDLNSKLLDGNYELISKFEQTKSGILEKVTFPTGGYINLEYELNKYKIDNLEFTGGGLRVKKQIVSDGITENTFFYQYTGEDNFTSGTINKLPKRVKFEFSGQYPLNENNYNSNSFIFTKYNSIKSNVELTDGSYVGYSKVKVFELNKGYTVYEYTNTISNPNLSPNVVPVFHNFYPNSFFINLTNAYKLNEQYSLYFNNDKYRGKILKESVFNNSNQLLNSTVNTYEEKIFKDALMVMPIIQSASTLNGIPLDCSSEFLYYKQFRHLLKTTESKTYFGNNSLNNLETYTYDDNLPLIKSSKSVSPTKTKESINYYPNDSEVGNLPFINKLLEENRLSELIKQKEFVDQNLVNTKLVNFDLFQNTVTINKHYLLKSISTSKGANQLEEDMIITNRDDKTNVIEYKNKNNLYFVIIYGYNKTLPIAKIENATYASIPASTITNLQSLSNTGTEANLISALNNLRSSLPNAMVTTFTHKPLIGVSTVTDPKGDVQSYHYDSFNRLQYVKDKEGNTLSENQYHYKN